MFLPALSGIIDRRILANFRIDPECMAAALPKPFRPHLLGSFAIGGICLIRLKAVRPKRWPLPWGICSENAAHRIAVEWDTDDTTNQGVFIPRRDTNSWLNCWAGGRLFPGIHHHARFTVLEKDPYYSVSMESDDGRANVQVSGTVMPHLAKGSAFASIQEASDFFEKGSLGYSPSKTEGHFEGLELQCANWHVESLDTESIDSSYFEDRSRFPAGSVTFDCALVMHNIVHDWHGRPQLCCPGGIGA